jgi:hypothetical protein
MDCWGGRLPASLKRLHVVEWGVTIVLFMAALNFVLALLTGGRGRAFGLWWMSATPTSLFGPLLVTLGASIIACWIRAKNHGVSVSKRLRSPVLLFLSVVFIYSLNGRSLTAGDTIPASYLPLSLLREFDLDLDEFPFLYEPALPWFVQRIGSHIVSAYPPWAGILALPVYLLPVVGGLAAPSPWIHELEKLSATLITALSTILLLAALRRLTSEKIAWCIAIIYAFGTSSFSSSSQALWQHGPSQLFLSLTLYWLVRGLSEPRFSAWAGLALASAVICRPTNALMAVPLVVYVLRHRRDQLAGFLAAMLPPALMLAAYNARYFGSPFTTGVVGATGPSRLLNEAALMFNTPLHEGLAGILVSPGRGLFIYSPILLVALVGMVMVWKDSRPVLLRYVSLAPLPIVFLIAKWTNWWGGGSYGPRLLADITPFLCLFLFPPFEKAQSRRFLRYLFACLATLSIGLHALRVFGGGDWNGHPNVDRHPERLWSWTDSPPVYHGYNLVRDVYAKVQRFSEGLPTSRNAPEHLAASYRLSGPMPGMTMRPNTFFASRVDVVNEGQAVWLARAQWEKGEVRLRWRWFTAESEEPSSTGGWLIGYDILPGQSYQFALEIATPPEPGEYVLEFDLVSIGVAPFSDQGVAPLTVPLRVIRPSP